MSDITSSILTHWHGHPDAILGLLLIQSLYLIGIGPLRIKLNLSQTYDRFKPKTFEKLQKIIEKTGLKQVAIQH